MAVEFSPVGPADRHLALRRGASDWSDLEKLEPEDIAYVQFSDGAPLDSHDLMPSVRSRSSPHDRLPGDAEVLGVRARGRSPAAGGHPQLNGVLWLLSSNSAVMTSP